MKHITLISADPVLRRTAEDLMKDHADMVAFHSIKFALDHIYSDMSQLLILDIKADDAHTVAVLNTLKNDPMFNTLPVLAILPEDFTHRQWESLLIEDFLRISQMERELATRVSFCITRAERTVEMNPLTRLPGNISTTKQIQSRLDEKVPFALAYADLDHFKPFNDKYGFSRGDEVIKITGRLILNIVKNRQPHDSFVGHIGGDDFVFIMDTPVVEDVSKDIIGAFDKIITTFYDPDDRERGYIQSKDRQGTKQLFDIMTLSIGITSSMATTFSHYGEITERASEMKRYAKQFKGSCFRSDKRRDG